MEGCGEASLFRFCQSPGAVSALLYTGLEQPTGGLGTGNGVGWVRVNVFFTNDEMSPLLRALVTTFPPSQKQGVQRLHRLRYRTL